VRGGGPVVMVDHKKLWKAINYRLFWTSKTAVEVAKLLGFSTQIFSDIKAEAEGRGQPAGHGRADHRNYQPSAPIFLTICWWLGRDPRDFTKVTRAIPQAEIPEDDDAADRLAAWADVDNPA
jgi:hypothetical protein